MHPLIGITAPLDKTEQRVVLKSAYQQAIIATGGIPLIIAPVLGQEALEQITAVLHGLLLPGGVDVNPKRYGEDQHPNLDRVDDDLDTLEFTLISAARNRKLPILGICRGCQVLNVAFGGTLWQDIPSQKSSDIAHSQHGLPRTHLTHPIEITQGSKLFTALQQTVISVNSFHHQAIKELGAGLQPVAYAPDGIIEGIESSSGYILGIQCHPEDLYAATPAWLYLFASFIEAARQRASIAEQQTRHFCS